MIPEWIIWGFAFDDRFIDGTHGLADSVAAARRVPVYQQIVDQPETVADPDDPYPVSLQDICLRLASSAGDEQIQRFVDGATSFLLGYACKAVLVGAQAVPSLAEYAAQRRHDVGLYSNLALIDYAGGFTLPTSLWCDARIRALHAMSPGRWPMATTCTPMARRAARVPPAVRARRAVRLLPGEGAAALS